MTQRTIKNKEPSNNILITNPYSQSIENYHSIMNPSSQRFSNNLILQTLVNIPEDSDSTSFIYNPLNTTSQDIDKPTDLYKSTSLNLTLLGKPQVIKDTTTNQRHFNSDSYFAPWNKAKISKDYETDFEILVSNIPQGVKHEDLYLLFKGVINIDIIE